MFILLLMELLQLLLLPVTYNQVMYYYWAYLWEKHNCNVFWWFSFFFCHAAH